MNKLKQLTDIYNWKFSRTQNETGRSEEKGEWIGASPMNPELITRAAAELTMMEAQNTALVTVNDELHEQVARITAENTALRKALKLSAEMFHGSALAYGGSIHDAGKFTDCNNGYCLEAAAQLKKTS